jgi:hypothetical protein
MKQIQTKQLLITFDYELFLGKSSGTVTNCLIKPTELILRVLKKNDFKKAIFFVDTVYLLKMKKMAGAFPKIKYDYKRILNQLVQIHEEGHYLFPHIHPHWLDAHYVPEQNTWDLSNQTKYRFANIPDQQQDELLCDSLSILKEILGEEHSLDGYRAGGWCILPFSDFKPHFIKYNVKYDFSVLRGFYLDNGVQQFNFTNLPSKDIYCFSSDPVEEDKQGDLVEFTISTHVISSLTRLLDKVFNKISWKLGIKNMGDGLSALESMGEESRIEKRMISIDLLNSVTLYSYRQYLSKHHYMQFISHPKMLSRHSVVVFDLFLSNAVKKYRIESDFRKMICVRI